jgi:hypothetical protein
MSEGRQGRRWTVTDAWGNPVYLTDERWKHICRGHPVMAGFEGKLRETIRRGRRRRDTVDVDKFRYVLRVPDLPDGRTHIQAVVLYRDVETEDDAASANNWILTAYTKNFG